MNKVSFRHIVLTKLVCLVKSVKACVYYTINGLWQGCIHNLSSIEEIICHICICTKQKVSKVWTSSNTINVWFQEKVYIVHALNCNADEALAVAYWWITKDFLGCFLFSVFVQTKYECFFNFILALSCTMTINMS